MRHVQAFDKSHRQFFELFALWFVRTLYKETNRHFNTLRVTFTHARNSDLRGDGLRLPAYSDPRRRVELAGQQLADRGVQSDGSVQERLPLRHDGPAQCQWRRIE